MDKFNNQWVGRGEPISCTLQSSHLSSLDFFLWRYIRTKIKDLNDLKTRIIQEIQSVEENSLS